jgi:hypothetical protein
MKRVLRLLLTLLLFWAVEGSFAQTHPAAAKKKTMTAADSAKEKEFYLELRGTIRQLKRTETENEKTELSTPLDSVLVTIYNGDIPYSEFWTNKKGRCSFKLPLDKTFKIEVSRKGFVSKYIIVNSKVPYEQKDAFSFSFDVDLFEDVAGLDVSVLKNPIAKVSYSLSLEGFAYDVGYTSKINTDLKKMYKNYYRLQKIAADSSLFQNDSINVTDTNSKKK